MFGFFGFCYFRLSAFWGSSQKVVGF
ncbi:hypothetical protein LX77_02277 [Gelidibacter algens]|uniref:Uncharacterized protein n=1 Tax=Gelidibacter algens TaxID=49280 RepID=A0A327S570_9FLAO|nr:hypothetical protein LX77_02277 [Gelidibacter algens]